MTTPPENILIFETKKVASWILSQAPSDVTPEQRELIIGCFKDTAAVTKTPADWRLAAVVIMPLLYSGGLSRQMCASLFALLIIGLPSNQALDYLLWHLDTGAIITTPDMEEHTTSRRFFSDAQ